MKRINNLLFTGIFLLSIPTFTSYNNPFRIPLEKKLREIEKDKYVLNTSDCRHKAWRYYMNLKEAGEDVDLIIGRVNNSDVLHAYIRERDGRILDPTFRNNQDGGFYEKGINREEAYVFTGYPSIEEFVIRKCTKKSRKILSEIKRSQNKHKTKIKTKNKKYPSTKEIIESIKKYCKKDSAVYHNYMEKVNRKTN